MIVLEARRSCKRPWASVTLRAACCVRGPSRTHRTTPHGAGIIAPMSERGLPTEGAPACPFVAFEDDRDGRSTAPDHRHRCFAEPRPAPRALAHQEAYCLSSAFPVCPTFQDWARREAAAARPVAASAGTRPREEPPESRPMPPSARAPYRPPGRRRLPRPGGRTRSATGPPRPRGSATSRTGGPRAGRGRRRSRGRRRVARRSPARLEQRVRRPRRQPPRDRLAGPDPDEPRSARATGDPDRHGDDLDDAWPAAPRRRARRAPVPYVAGSATARPSTASRARAARPAATPPAPALVRRPGRARPSAQDPSELFGPAWERPRRYEAYPTLRTRMGLPGAGRHPEGRGLGADPPARGAAPVPVRPVAAGLRRRTTAAAAGATPTPAATEQATAEPEPTAPPAPTPAGLHRRQGRHDVARSRRSTA